MSSTSKLECDRYGVPQYSGDADCFEEYEERCWDLFYGRDGQDALQIATPLHLRAGLSGTAYDAVRKLEHSKLRTAVEGRATEAGMKMLLATLRDNIAAEKPVKINELFLTAFYSPSVWRKSGESMQQYIIRREQDFNRLKEASSETNISVNLRCMMLLIFSGLDHREQLSILASVNNEYDFKKVSHALRIQYPTAGTRPVMRKDFLGCGRQSSVPFKPQRWKMNSNKPRSVLAVDDQEIEDEQAFDDAYYEFEDDPGDEVEEAYEAYSDDEELEALMAEMPDCMENPEAAEALATVAQFRHKKKMFTGGKSGGKSQSSAQNNSYPFVAKGDIAFDPKSKENRQKAVRFLKSVTPCTSCHQKGHWMGDPECPNSKKGKGKGKKSTKGHSPSKAKKPSQNLFVLHDGIESADEAENLYVRGNYENEPNDTADYDFVMTTDTKEVSDELYGILTEEDKGKKSSSFSEAAAPSFTATEFKTNVKECLVNFRETKLCEHASSNGGREREYHRGANGHTRHITCKECNETVIVARRKQPIQLWSYLVQIAMCTKWGQKMRSTALYHRVSALTSQQLLDNDHVEKKTPIKARLLSPSTRSEAEWDLVSHPGSNKEGYPSSSGGGPKEKPRVATIVREPSVQCWLYGVRLAPNVPLPDFPELAISDLDVLQPLPTDSSVLNVGPFLGLTFERLSSELEYEQYATQVLQFALNNQPMLPEVFRFAYYLFGKVKLAHGAALKMYQASTDPASAAMFLKRTFSPSDDMQASRLIVVPVYTDIKNTGTLQQAFCDVMMVESPETPESYALESDDLPGLAILDSGCSRTMHGEGWSSAFEEELKKLGISVKARDKSQTFKGVGGQTESTVVKIFPFGIGGKNHGYIHSAETPGNTPMLISRPFMRELGTILNLGDGTVSFTKLGVFDLPIVRTKRGHPAVNLLHFNADKLDEFSSEPSSPQDELSQQQWHAEERAEPDSSPQSGQLSAVYGSEESGYPYTPVGSSIENEPPGYRRELQDQWEIMFGIEPGWEPPEYNPPDQGDPQGDHLCDHCEIAQEFEILLAEGSFTVRKASHRKNKKIEAMDLALDGYDLRINQQISGTSKLKVSRKPPCGKTWLKQVFAGQMGISLLAFAFGMSIGVPLDISTVGWDASTSAGRKHLHNDLQAEDPYCVVITHPCGPWGNWSRFNIAKGGQVAETILELRDDNRPVLKTVNKLVRDRVRQKRHIFLEQPLGSQSIHEPEMADVKKLIEEGELIYLVVDGCMVGYKDAESKKPYNKPSYYITSMIAAESMFSDLRCDKAHEHEHLEGSNKYGSRTKQASVWPSKLNQLVIDCIVQQADIEKTAASSVAEAFPSEVRHQPEQGGRRMKRRRGRVATLTAGSAAPPVYIRPSQPDTPDPLQEAEEPDDVPEDDQGHRAQQTSSLEPILNENEGERRYLWLQVDADLRKLVRDLHVNFGHCTNVTLQRILRRQGAKIEAIKAAGLLSCDACGDSIRRRRPRPVKLPPRYQFNYHLMMDTFYARDGRGLQFAFLNIICEATSFQVVSCLGELSGPPSSQVVLRHFLTSWSSWAGLPNSIQVDRGKEFMARFADYLKNFNVEQEVMPLEAPWKGGKCDRAGGLWKELWNKTVSECNIQGLEDALTATAIVTQTRNSFPRSNGYAPNQWVLGQPEVKLPASLLSSEPQEQLEVLEAAENPESAMARTLQIRETARVAQIRLDTSSRVRRALLRQSTPTRGPFPVGSYVYFFRRQQPSRVSASGKNYNWFGPARVIGVELRNPRRLEDPEDATEGTAPHSYWLRYGPSVVLCTGEQLRFASEDELLAAHYVPTFAVDPNGERGARNYVDLRHHTYGQLPDGTQVSDAVNQDHWTSHSDGRVIRHHNVPRRALFDPRNQGCPVPVEQLSTARKTEVIYSYERGDHVLTDTIDDDWTSEAGQRDLSADWVGDTIFWRRERAPQLSSVPPGLFGPTRLSQPLPAIPEEGEEPATPVPMDQEQRTGDNIVERPFDEDIPLPPIEHHRQLTVAEPEPQPQVLYPEQQAHQPPVLSAALRNPDRLDGYGPLNRGRGHQVHGPYITEENDWPSGCEDIHQSIKKLKNFNQEDDDEDVSGDSSEGEQQALLLQQQEPPDVFLTGKAVRSEVNLKTLSPEDRAKFDASMAKEWASWMNFGAAEILTEQQIAELPDDAEIIGTRWVHTDKNKKPRLLAEAMKKKTGKSDAQIQREFPFEAKSRMVVQGNQEVASEIRSDSPTASLLAFNFVTVISVLNNWFLAAYDASTAYLQSKGIARLLILRPPYPPPPGISPSDLLRAKGSIYGTRDAGRSWWKKLYRVLRESGWTMSKLEPALFYLFDESFNLTGALVTHVDDLYVTGTGEKFHAIMKNLETEIFLKKKEGKFRFCGKEIERDDQGSVHLHQADAIESLEYIVLEKHRRTSPNSKLTETEKSQFRALIGSLGWIARQSRPDVLVNVSMASQKMGSPAIRDILDLNKVVKVLKESVDFRWTFHHPKDYILENAIVFCMADSSFANGDNHKSQCGYLVGLSWPSITSGGETPILLMETYSGSIKRVCRSTLAAEANGFLTGVEAADFVRSLLLEMLNPGKKIHELESNYVRHKMIAFTDAKSLESTLNKDAGAPSDKRVRILLAQIKEMIGMDGYSEENNLQVWWCDTAQMLADVLTKTGCEREPLMEAMASGNWKLEASDVAKAKKVAIREGRQRRKQQKRLQAEDG